MAAADDFDSYIEQLGISLGDLRSGLDSLAEQIKKDMVQGRTTLEQAKAYAKATHDGIRAQRDHTRAVQDDTRHVRDHTNRISDLNEELEFLDEAIAATTDSAKKDSLERQKAIIQQQQHQVLRDALMKNFQQSFAGLITGLGTSIGRAVMRTSTSLLSGGSDFGAATEMMRSTVDMASGAAKVGANSLATAGQAASMMGGKMRIAGIAAQGLGIGLGVLTGAVSELAKAGIGFLLTQTQKTITVFHALSQAGASFTGGMVEMRTHAVSAGWTLEQFGKVVTNNSAIMTLAGQTVTEAAKELAGVGKIIRDSQIQQSLLNLGYSIEDQADMAAKVMSNMNRYAAPGAAATASEIATQTEEYARNLKIIADITGEDAKSKAEQTRLASQELAFQAKLAKMDPKQRQQVENGMNTLDQQAQKDLREMIVTGGHIVNQAGAVRMALNSGYARSMQQHYSDVKSGSWSGDRARRTQSANADETQQAALAAAGSVGVAGMLSGGPAGDWAKSQQELNVSASQMKNNAQAEQNADGAKRGKGSEEITAAQIENQKMLLAMEKLATDHLGQFGDALKSTTAILVKAVDAIGSVTKDSALPGFWSTIGSGLIMGLTGILSPLLLTLFTGKGASTAGGAVGGAAGAGAGAGAGKVGGFLGKMGGGMGRLAPQLIMGAGALAIFGGALWVISKAVQGFEKVDWANVSLGFLAIGAAAVGATALGMAGPLLAIGAAGIGLLGAAMWLFPIDLITGIANAMPLLADGFISLSQGVDVGNLALFGGALVGLSAAFVPFAVGALAVSKSGFVEVAEGLKKFEALDPNKLMQVSAAMKDMRDNMPSAGELIAITASNVWDRITGGSSPAASTQAAEKSTTNLPTSPEDPKTLMLEMKRMTELLSAQNDLTESQIQQSKTLVDIAKNQLAMSERIYNASI